MNKFESNIEIRWSDVDQNRHVRHSAYYDYGAHCRIRFFKAIGLDSDKMNTIQLGPIIFKESCSFIKELHLDDCVKINVLRGNVSIDGSKWELHHEIRNEEGHKCAHLSLSGAWMNLVLRKLVIPPKFILDALLALPKGKGYVYQKS